MDRKADPFQTMNILENNLVIRIETVTRHGSSCWHKNIKDWLYIYIVKMTTSCDYFIQKFLLNTVCQSLSYETRSNIYWAPTMYQALYILTPLNPHDNSLRQILVWVMWNFHFHGSKRLNIGKFLESDLNVNVFLFYR